MTLVPSTAASAVYHDALTTARGFRSLCFFLLLLILLLQLGLFFTARYTDGIIPVRGSEAQRTGQSDLPTGVSGSTTQRAEVEQNADGTAEVDRDARLDLDLERTGVSSDKVADWIYFALYFTLWGGMVLAILLSLTLVFTTLVMLNGRTVGVSRVASAFFWSLVLLLLLMPWQAILNHPTLSGGPFHLPGVLYTWDELYANGKHFVGPDWMGWARFVGWPALALVILLIVGAKARRGVKEALGEDLPDLDADRPIS